MTLSRLEEHFSALKCQSLAFPTPILTDILRLHSFKINPASFFYSHQSTKTTSVTMAPFFMYRPEQTKIASR